MRSVWTWVLGLAAIGLPALCVLLAGPRGVLLAVACAAWLAWVWQLRRSWKRRERFERMLARRCAGCDYDLRGNPDAATGLHGARCPECGRPVRSPLRPHFARVP